MSRSYNWNDFDAKFADLYNKYRRGQISREQYINGVNNINITGPFTPYNLYESLSQYYKDYDEDKFEVMPNFNNFGNPRLEAYKAHLERESANLNDLLRDFQENWETRLK